MGIISSSSSKDPNDPRWAGDKDVQDYIAFKKSYFPEGDPTDTLAQGGYRLPQMMLRRLDKCGNNLTRENLMYWRLT